MGGSRHHFAKFQLPLSHYSPYHDALQVVGVSAPYRSGQCGATHTKAARLGKRPLSWLDWQNSISSFCFFNIFFIFSNKINTIALFWYYVSCSSVKRLPAKCLPSHSMLTKLNISRRGILVCSTVIAFITSLCVSLFPWHGVPCSSRTGWKEVLHACWACSAEINRCHEQKNKGRQACVGGKSIDCLCQQDSLFATSSAVLETSGESLCRCPFQRELFNRVYLQLCMLPHAAESPLFETVSVSRGLTASSQTIQKFMLLNQHLGESLGLYLMYWRQWRETFLKFRSCLFKHNSRLSNCKHINTYSGTQFYWEQ